MNRTMTRPLEMEPFPSILTRVERRLGAALALLLLGIFGILGATVAQPVVHYLTGSPMQVAAALDGAGCGAHLSWESESQEIASGSRVTFVNATTYWTIPVVIERKTSDGTYEVVARSDGLRDGESWKHTFWRKGDYRIISADETQRDAGLETVLTVR